jgi:hypothetical protein
MSLFNFFIKKESLQFKEIQSQINNLKIPTEVVAFSEGFSLLKLSEFTEKYVKKLVNKYNIKLLQESIDNDSNPLNPVINYITCLMEIGILHELFKQSFATQNNSILNARLEFLAWAVNICVANNLKNIGIKRIPMLTGGICIYYTWDNMQNIINRIYPIAAQIDGADSKEIDAYINNLIEKNL